jgi:hypothetical protein
MGEILERETPPDQAPRSHLERAYLAGLELIEVADEEQMREAVDPLQARSELRKDLHLTVDVGLLGPHVGLAGLRVHHADGRQID